MELKEKIAQQAVACFRQEGLGFTMQQVAQGLHISKKTIYTLYPGKEALLLDMIDNLFARIHGKKRQLAQGSGSVPERLKGVLSALPEEYAAMDFRLLPELEEKYPAAAARVRHHLETGWELTLQLLREGMDQGVLRRVDPRLLQQVLTAAFSALLSAPSDPSCSYGAQLETLVDIVMNGLKERDP